MNKLNAKKVKELILEAQHRELEQILELKEEDAKNGNDNSRWYSEISNFTKTELDKLGFETKKVKLESTGKMWIEICCK